MKPREFWIRQGHHRPDWIESEKPPERDEIKYGPFIHVIEKSALDALEKQNTELREALKKIRDETFDGVEQQDMDVVDCWQECQDIAERALAKAEGRSE